jgi:hypothetical protein
MGKRMTNAAYTNGNTVLVDTGGEVMADRFVEVQDDYPMLSDACR